MERKYYSAMSKKQAAAEIEQADIDNANDRIDHARKVIELRPIGKGTGWRDEALCSALDPELFDTSHHTDREIKIAKKVCQACDVQIECSEYILTAHPSNEGTMIWGGMTPDEIRHERGKRIRAAKRRAR